MTTLLLPKDSDDARSVSRFDVERLAVGELKGSERARVEAAVAADAVLKAFFDDVVASDKAFLFENPPAKFFANAGATATATATATAPTFADKLIAFFKSPQLISSLCAAAAVVVIVNAPFGAGSDGGSRIKGGAHEPSVAFFVQDGEAARLGHAGEALKAGDKIQLAVKDVDKAAMVVVGVDSNGVVSVYARESVSTTAKGPVASSSSSSSLSKARLLPASLVLDDTTGPERFFVVYGDDLDDLERAARAAAAALGDDVKAGRRSLESTARLDVDGPQSSVHILKVR